MPTTPTSRVGVARPVTPSPRLRQVFLWVGSTVTVVALGFTLFSLVNNIAWHTYVVERAVGGAEMTGIGTVEIDNSAGDTTVVGGPDPGTRLTSVVTDGIFSADHGLRLDGDRLRITGDCPVAFATHCHVDHRVELPGALALELRNRHGQLEVSGVRGPIRVDSGFGGLMIEGAAAPLDIEHRFGTIELRGIASPVVAVDHAFGELEARFDEAPEHLDIVLRFGEAVIEVPDDGNTYAVTGSTSFGERSIEVRTDPTSERRIHVDQRFGNLTIRHPR